MNKLYKKHVSMIAYLGKFKFLTAGVVIVLLLVGGYFWLSHKTTTRQFITVRKGTITQSVSLTGNTTPAKSVMLAFGSSGIISWINGSLGGRVYAGQVLASLDTNDLSAQLKEAQANVDTQQARLQGLQAGARPEDIAASQAAVDKANQDLANLYAGISDISLDSYTKANDAVRVQLESFFSNPETNPKLTYLTSDSQAQIDAETQRATLSGLLNGWQKALSSGDQSATTIDAQIQNELSYLNAIRQFLQIVSKTLNNTPGLNPSTVAAYQTDISSATSEINLATKNLNAVLQSIASQKLVVSQAQAQLNLKRAGNTSSDIAAQKAQVEQAQAQVASAQAKLINAQIVSPINGTITQFDAKIGQFASPSTALISIISSSGYEVDAGVSETDIGKMQVGNKVIMTLDAFPGETFSGTVFYIAPADTATQGVITYQVKISFDKGDPRLKSGLTANVTIETKHKDSVLILPQYAILQSDQGTFVEVLQNTTVVQVPVVLGIQDQEGNVEVTSGVIEGEKVLNIGLKQK